MSHQTMLPSNEAHWINVFSNVDAIITRVLAVLLSNEIIRALLTLFGESSHTK